MRPWTLLLAVAVLSLAFSGCASHRSRQADISGPTETDEGFFAPSRTPHESAARTSTTTAHPATGVPAETGDVGGAVAMVNPFDVYPSGISHEEDGVILGVEPRAIGGSFHTGFDSYEPTIGTDSKGRIFVGAVFKIAVSEDRGQTFRLIAGEVNGLNLHTASFDPYLLVDPVTDRLYQLDVDPAPGGLVLSWTDDAGATWSHDPAAYGSPSANDHPTLVAARPRTLPTLGYPNVLHLCVNGAVYTACTASLDGGRTFRPQVPLFAVADVGNCPGGDGSVGPVAPSNGQTGHLRADADGTVLLPLARCFASGNGFPLVVVSKDDGLTWTPHAVTQKQEDLADDHDVDVAVDASHNLYASWNSRGRMVLARSTDGGATWTRPFNITAPGITGTAFNAIGSLGPDLVAVAYLGTQIPGGYDGRTEGTGGLVGEVQGEPDPPEWAGADWHALITVADFKDPDHPRFLSVTGNPVEDPLARGLCGRTRCHGMADFIDLFVDADGRPWASFVDVCNTACAKHRARHWDAAQGMAVTLLSGPSLRDGSALPSLDPQRDVPTPSG